MIMFFFGVGDFLKNDPFFINVVISNRFCFGKNICQLLVGAICQKTTKSASKTKRLERIFLGKFSPFSAKMAIFSWGSTFRSFSFFWLVWLHFCHFLAVEIDQNSKELGKKSNFHDQIFLGKFFPNVTFLRFLMFFGPVGEKRDFSKVCSQLGHGTHIRGSARAERGKGRRDPFKNDKIWPLGCSKAQKQCPDIDFRPNCAYFSKFYWKIEISDSLLTDPTPWSRGGSRRGRVRRRASRFIKKWCNWPRKGSSNQK